MSETVRSQLAVVAARFNAAVVAGKVRALRKVAEESHREVMESLTRFAADPGADPDLVREANEFLLDIRFGRKTARFPTA